MDMDVPEETYEQDIPQSPAYTTPKARTMHSDNNRSVKKNPVSEIADEDEPYRYTPLKANEMNIIDVEVDEPASVNSPEVHYTEDGRKYTAFAPKKYSSLYEAMNDSKYSSEAGADSIGDIMNAAELAALQKSSPDDTMSDMYGSDGSKKSLPTRVIRKPDWEILSVDNRKSPR